MPSHTPGRTEPPEPLPREAIDRARAIIRRAGALPTAANELSDEAITELISNNPTLFASIQNSAEFDKVQATERALPLFDTGHPKQAQTQAQTSDLLHVFTNRLITLDRRRKEINHNRDHDKITGAIREALWAVGLLFLAPPVPKNLNDEAIIQAALDYLSDIGIDIDP